MRNSVVSDSSFYIAFLSRDEIEDPEFLFEMLQNYDFFLGDVVLNEITEKHDGLLSRIKESMNVLKEYDYSALFSMIGDKIFKKGEYECMAIAYHLHKKSTLHSLILDDNVARKFVEKNIPSLQPFVKYSLRFIVACCCSDQKISTDRVFIVLNKVKESIRNGNRPFNLTEENINIVDQLLSEVEECQQLNFTHQ